MSFLHPGFSLSGRVRRLTAVVALHFLVSSSRGLVFSRRCALSRMSGTLYCADRSSFRSAAALDSRADAGADRRGVRAATAEAVTIGSLESWRWIFRATGEALPRWAIALPKYLADAASVVVFDSAATEASPGSAEFGGDIPLGTVASLSRWITFVGVDCRTARSIPVSERADSLDLVLISLCSPKSVTARRLAIRSLWPERDQDRARGACTRTLRPPLSGLRRRVGGFGADVTSWVLRSISPTQSVDCALSAASLVYPFVRRWKLALAPIVPSV